MILQSEEACPKAHETKWRNLHVTVGAKTGRKGAWGKLIRQWQGLRNDFRLFRELRTGRYDLIQVKDKFVTALLAILGSLRYRVPFVYWLSFSIPEAQIYKARNRHTRYPLILAVRGRIYGFILYRLIPKFAKHIFVQSDAMKAQLAAKGIPEERMTAVPMGVSRGDLPQDLSQAESHGSQPDLIYIGALDRSRGLDFLIRVHRRVLERIPEATLYLVGGAPLEEDVEFLKQEAVREGISQQVVFTGFLPRDEVWRLVAASRVCLSPMLPVPMLVTTTPTKCQEYMALGRPVIGNEEIPDMQTVLIQSGGGICVPWDEGAFARAAMELLSEPEKADRMGRKGKEWILRNREYDVLAEAVEKEYTRIVDRNSKTVK